MTADTIVHPEHETLAEVSSAEEVLLAPDHSHKRMSTWRIIGGVVAVVGLGLVAGYVGTGTHGIVRPSSLTTLFGGWGASPLGFGDRGQCAAGQHCDCGWAADPMACAHVDNNPCWNCCCQQQHPDMWQQAQRGGVSAGSGGHAGSGYVPYTNGGDRGYGYGYGNDGRGGFGGRLDEYDSDSDGDYAHDHDHDHDHHHSHHDDDDDYYGHGRHHDHDDDYPSHRRTGNHDDGYPSHRRTAFS